jgi:DNA-binding IclR family transcriptional regulator
LVVAFPQSGQNLQLSTQIGSRFPALNSATGRCIAAFGAYPETRLETKFKSLRWDDAPTYEQWQTQVKQTRSQGYAIDDGNYISGVTVIAAPVWKARAKLSHALVAIGIGSAQRSGLASLATALRSSSQTLSTQLSGETLPEWP